MFFIESLILYCVLSAGHYDTCKSIEKTKTVSKKLVPSCSVKSKQRKTLVPQPSPPSSSEDITYLSEEADDSEAESDDGMCEKCEVRYADDDEEMKMCWMGCDSCIRWFHCHCVDLSEIPTGFWSCQYCS